jgi:hypothetical protein
VIFRNAPPLSIYSHLQLSATQLIFWSANCRCRHLGIGSWHLPKCWQIDYRFANLKSIAMKV